MARLAKKALPWMGKIINTAQVGGIETSVLDNGAGRGSRIAWVNTATGLRYKIAVDRSLDIVDAFFNQHALAHLSDAATCNPRPDTNHGIAWLDSFNCGLVATCGLTHMGGPESDDSGQRGLHGKVGNTTAFIESVINPDAAAGRLDFSITAVIKETSFFGPNLELRRTISGKLGEATIIIRDEVTNRANTPAPHMMLYHCNFGWPLMDAGTEIVWRGKWQSMGRPCDNAIFNDRNNFKKCLSPQESHRGFGEACAIIDIAADRRGLCRTGLYNAKLGLAFTIEFKKEQLPKLTNWQHFGPNEYVVGMEPGTNGPIGQIKARKQKELIMLKPGEKRVYDLKLSVLAEKSQIQDFLRLAR